MAIIIIKIDTLLQYPQNIIMLCAQSLCLSWGLFVLLTALREVNGGFNTPYAILTAVSLIISSMSYISIMIGREYGMTTRVALVLRHISVVGTVVFMMMSCLSVMQHEPFYICRRKMVDRFAARIDVIAGGAGMVAAVALACMWLVNGYN